MIYLINITVSTFAILFEKICISLLTETKTEIDKACVNFSKHLFP